MLKPKAVTAPALVGVVAPASPLREEYLRAGLGELARRGFRTRMVDGILDRGRYTAGGRERRRAELLELWHDPEVAAIFAARGGYGAMELLELLDPAELSRHPKLLLGCSDITALTSFLAARAGIVSLHGPMVAQQIAREDYDYESLTGVMAAREPGLILRSPEARWLHRGRAEGLLFGGCLSILSALVGTPYLPDFEESVLFLEDIAVKPYQIDRMLLQLRLAGRLEGVKGIVFGQMPGCQQHPDQGYRLDELLRDLTRDLSIPVLFGFPSGHCNTPAMTIPIGVRVRLDDEGLTLLEGVVR